MRSIMGQTYDVIFDMVAGSSYAACIKILTLKEMIEDGRIKSIVDRVYPMEKASNAHRRVETEQRLGAVVIAIGERNVDLPIE